jgi:hypothetical protein
MGYWTLTLLALDVVFMAGVLYMLSGRGSRITDALVSGGGGRQEAGPGAEPRVLIKELKDELDAVKRTSAQFEKKQAVLEDYEITIRDRRRSLDRMIREVDKSVEDIRCSSRDRDRDDVYKRAMEMIGKGTSVDRVMKSLGILEGEAELISALNSYRN